MLIQSSSSAWNSLGATISSRQELYVSAVLAVGPEGQLATSEFSDWSQSLCNDDDAGGRSEISWIMTLPLDGNHITNAEISWCFRRNNQWGQIYYIESALKLNSIQICVQMQGLKVKILHCQRVAARWTICCTFLLLQGELPKNVPSAGFVWPWRNVEFIKILPHDLPPTKGCACVSFFVCCCFLPVLISNHGRSVSSPSVKTPRQELKSEESNTRTHPYTHTLAKIETKQFHSSLHNPNEGHAWCFTTTSRKF